MKRLCFIIFILYSTLIFAQGGIFSALGGGANGAVRSMAYDSLNKKLYISGDFTKVNTTFNAKNKAVWDGLQWDSLNHILGDTIASFQSFKGAVYGLGGSFLKKLNPYTGVWQTLAQIGKWGNITFVTSYQGDLVIAGIFDTINGQAIKHIARFDGSNVYPFDNTNFNGGLNSAVEFQGKLYLCGGLFFTGNCGTLHRLAVWDGNCWSSFASGMQGGFGGVYKLEVFENKLYVAGSFFKSNGSPGNCFFSFDGVNFDDLGGGFMGINGFISCMSVYKNKILLSGDWWSTIPGTSTICPNFFSFDGENFCTYFDYQQSNNSVWGIEAMKDSIVFSIPNVTVGFDNIKTIGKYMGDINNPLSCVSVVGMNENQNSPFQNIKLYPNPFSSVLNIKLPDDFDLSNANLTLNDCLGKELLSGRIQNLNEKLELGMLESGIYFIKISTPVTLRVFKIIKE